MALCLCGCDAEVRGRWVRGHHSRVNNISKRDDVREMRRIAMQKLHDEGKMPDPWNVGLTKDVDERLRTQGQTWKENLTDENRKLFSDLMKKNRLSGVIRTCRGSEHGQWRGGTSTITQRIRAHGGLYKLWKYPILKRDDFMCVFCKRGSDKIKLAVHHDGERFADIVKKFIPEDLHELSWDEQTKICNQIAEYHVKNNISGKTLCYDCHEIVHSDDITPDFD